MQSQQAQGDDYYNYNKTTFRPVEQSLADDAMAFSEAGAKEAYSRSAAADLEKQQASEAAQTNRALTASGVNPNSAKFVAIKKQQEVGNAAARAGAVTTARDKADSLSTAKRLEVAGLGRGLTGAAQGSYGLALNAGNSAVSNNAQAGNSLVNGMSAGNGTIMAGSAQNISGLGSILSSQTSVYGAQSSANSASAAGSGQMAGAAVGGIAMAI